MYNCVFKSCLSHYPGRVGLLAWQGHLAHGTNRTGIDCWPCLLLTGTNAWSFLILFLYKKASKTCFNLFIQSLQSCPTLCNPVACSPPGSSVHGFSSQEYWSGLLFSPPGDLSHPEIKPVSLASPAQAGRLLTTSATWEPHSLIHPFKYFWEWLWDKVALQALETEQWTRRTQIPPSFLCRRWDHEQNK